MHILDPANDLSFGLRSKIHISTSTCKNHLHGQNGEAVSDSTTIKPFRNVGLHVCGSQKKAHEKLDAMAQALLEKNWKLFKALSRELRFFKPKQEYLNAFGREQMKLAVSISLPIHDVITVRKKLVSIGASNPSIDRGYEEGCKIFESLLKN